ncbi:VWA domain-containing protein [Candidatus Uhrbacteria bacterium]|nr:VWA domain-containing protein [Candidatus Uhrbacteria bacterium]
MGMFDGKKDKKVGSVGTLPAAPSDPKVAAPRLPAGNPAADRLLPGAAPAALAAPAIKPQDLKEQLRLRGKQEGGSATVVVGTLDVALLLDSTGSMDYLIASAKQQIGEIIRRIYETAPKGLKIRIQIINYRDYGSGSLLVEMSALTDEVEVLESYLRRIQTSGGEGNGGEAVEAGLEKVLAQNTFKVVLVAGDEQAHTRTNLQREGQGDKRTAEDIAQICKERKIPIHTFVVGNDGRCAQSFACIAALSGGQTGKLDGSDDMTHMAVMAILAAAGGSVQGGNALVQKYLTAHGGADGRALSGSSQAFAGKLLSGNK